jgi:hypothetical protein
MLAQHDKSQDTEYKAYKVLDNSFVEATTFIYTTENITNFQKECQRDGGDFEVPVSVVYPMPSPVVIANDNQLSEALTYQHLSVFNICTQYTMDKPIAAEDFKKIGSNLVLGTACPREKFYTECRRKNEISLGLGGEPRISFVDGNGLTEDDSDSLDDGPFSVVRPEGLIFYSQFNYKPGLSLNNKPACLARSGAFIQH